MRKIFESYRIENLEAIAALLEKHGILTQIEGGRGWRGAIRGNFSYRDKTQKTPPASLWVIDSNQQSQARELLRAQGLLTEQTQPHASYLPAHSQANRPMPWRKYLRIMLIATAFLLGMMLWLKPKTAPTTAAAPDSAAQQGSQPQLLHIPTSALTPHQLPTPPALAQALVQQQRTQHGLAQNSIICVQIDGADPSAEWLQKAGTHIHAASTCPADAMRLAIFDYTTDGLGSGVITLQLQQGTAPAQQTEFAVARTGFEWTITPPAP